jgi:hypothetical protein
MKIIVEVSNPELAEMEVNADELKARMYQQLDEATIGQYFPAISLTGYDIEVIVK